jgi:exonuclease SbcC
MLSLFLAAGITQTWSSFAPILMDDPITHFDDLNAYAFVELIRGFVDDAKGCRQFVISTCDESLWSLFRQRFSSLNGKAIMYKFVAIGDDGPVVERIS